MKIYLVRSEGSIIHGAFTQHSRALRYSKGGGPNSNVSIIELNVTTEADEHLVNITNLPKSQEEIDAIEKERNTPVDIPDKLKTRPLLPEDCFEVPNEMSKTEKRDREMVADHRKKQDHSDLTEDMIEQMWEKGGEPHEIKTLRWEHAVMRRILGDILECKRKLHIAETEGAKYAK